MQGGWGRRSQLEDVEPWAESSHPRPLAQAVAEGAGLGAGRWEGVEVRDVRAEQIRPYLVGTG